MGKVESIRPYLEPVRKTIVVKRTPREAFDIFTARMGTWWPVRQFSLYQTDSVECGIEPRVGGQIFEVSSTGERGVWGTIREWEPPHRFVTTWHPGSDPETPTELEVRFVAEGDGTRVELEHRHWTELGAQAAQTRQGYDEGWVMVFETCFREACS